MTDAAHVSTKFPNSLADSREITLVYIDNPTQSPILNYRTSLDPALVASKLVSVDQRLLDLNGEPIPAWLSNYGTGLSESEIWHKTNVLSGGKQVVTVGDAPWVNDLGPIVDLPSADQQSLADDWHKSVVTDLSACDVVIAASIQFPYVPFLASLYQSQMILFPVSARHIVKTSDGTLHAVTSYTISGLSRIVYFKSTNGGVKWTALVVDNNDGQHYILPSITCDRTGGIHITYTRWDQVTFSTFWLYAGGATPAGFELVSSAGGIGYHRMFGGGNASYYPTLDYNPDDYNVHTHVWSGSGGGTSSDIAKTTDPDQSRASLPGWHHTSGVLSLGLATSLPLSRSLKLLKYMGIPPSLPADIIVPFNSNVPAGFTRYSAQDGYGIYCSDDVGSVVGAAQSRHLLSYNLSGNKGGYGPANGSGPLISVDHDHVGSVYTAYANNNPPSFEVILGLVSAPRSIIPANALLFGGSSPSLSQLTLLSGVGGSLVDKYLVGGASYADLGGSTTNNHADLSFTTVGHTSGSCLGSIAMNNIDYAACAHGHLFYLSFVASSLVGSRIMPYTCRVDSPLDLITYGNDLFYRYISPTGTLATPVNISLIKQYYPSFEGVCLVDGVDDVHFLWSAQGLNTTPPSLARVSYKKITSGVLGSRVDLTTSENHMLYPSMDIDNVGDIHASWFNATTNQSLEYKKCTSGTWGAVEVIDSDSYVGCPSNIITDKDCNVFLLYAKWTDAGTAIKEVFYRKRTAGTWGAAVNLSPNKAASGYNQFTGQICLDNKGNVVFTWSGKGYGAHTSVYHPVYRYLSPAGTIVPAVGVDAVDMFPLDDLEIFYPTVFWHSYPLTDGVYQNLVTSGLTFMYLYNPRNGVNKDTVDLKFYSSADALVGDVGAVGIGGSGSGDFTPSGVGGESVLQQESFTVVQRGYLCKTNLNPTIMGNYMK